MVDDRQSQECENYITMLRKINWLIQELLLLTDKEEELREGAQSLSLVGALEAYERKEDIRICIWVEEVTEYMDT